MLGPDWVVSFFDLPVCCETVLCGSVLTLILGVADDTKSLLAFAVVGWGTGLGSSFVPGSLLGMCVSNASCFSMSVDSSIFSSNLVGPNVYLSLNSSLRPILLLANLACLLGEGLLAR